jgi:CubicO group peptidase (beta-lactamase class C family)
MLWVVVVAVQLLRSSPLVPLSAPHRRGHPMNTALHVDGYVSPGLEEVRAEFERNFIRRGEIGAAVAAYWRGEKVVDLWGGRRTPEGDEPWTEDTMVVVMSTTKGLSAMTLAVANGRGWLDYEAPVARYWPEFAQDGKAAVTVRQLLGHEAGLVLLDEQLTLEKLRDLDYLARVLARQTPAWPPGTRHKQHECRPALGAAAQLTRCNP